LQQQQELDADGPEFDPEPTNTKLYISMQCIPSAREILMN
jgi:hypothetical protein